MRVCVSSPFNVICYDCVSSAYFLPLLLLLFLISPFYVQLASPTLFGCLQYFLSSSRFSILAH